MKMNVSMKIYCLFVSGRLGVALLSSLMGAVSRFSVLLSEWMMAAQAPVGHSGFCGTFAPEFRRIDGPMGG